MLVELSWPRANVALLMLNDPDRLNAMSEVMAEDFRKHVDELRLKHPRVVVLTGAGRAFSAGGDLDMLWEKSQRGAERNRQDMEWFYHAFLGVLDLHVPVVAAINGVAVGAGFCLAAACDVRVSEPDASFGAPFLRLGLYPGMGTTHFLTHRLGGYASDLLLTGSRLSAQDAHRIGFVTRLSEKGKIQELALSVADEICLSAPGVTRNLLRRLRHAPTVLEEALQDEAQLQGASYLEDEFKEGLEAARERRAPKF